MGASRDPQRLHRLDLELVIFSGNSLELFPSLACCEVWLLILVWKVKMDKICHERERERVSDSIWGIEQEIKMGDL